MFLYIRLEYTHTQTDTHNTDRHTNKPTQKAGCGNGADQISWKKSTLIRLVTHTNKIKFVIIINLSHLAG